MSQYSEIYRPRSLKQRYQGIPEQTTYSTLNMAFRMLFLYILTTTSSTNSSAAICLRPTFL